MNFIFFFFFFFFTFCFLLCLMSVYAFRHRYFKLNLLKNIKQISHLIFDWSCSVTFLHHHRYPHQYHAGVRWKATLKWQVICTLLVLSWQLQLLPRGNYLKADVGKWFIYLWSLTLHLLEQFLSERIWLVADKVKPPSSPPHPKCNIGKSPNQHIVRWGQLYEEMARQLVCLIFFFLDWIFFSLWYLIYS